MTDPGKDKAACRGQPAYGSRDAPTDGRQSTPGSTGTASRTIDTAIIGLVMDRTFGDSENLARHIRNASARTLFDAFRKTESMQFLVLAGQLHREKGGVFGGLASGWSQAKALFAMAGLRCDELAAAGGESFTSQWFLCCSDARRDEIRGLVPQATA